LKMKK